MIKYLVAIILFGLIGSIQAAQSKKSTWASILGGARQEKAPLDNDALFPTIESVLGAQSPTSQNRSTGGGKKRREKGKPSVDVKVDKLPVDPSSMNALSGVVDSVPQSLIDAAIIDIESRLGVAKRMLAECAGVLAKSACENKEQLTCEIVVLEQACASIYGGRLDELRGYSSQTHDRVKAILDDMSFDADLCEEIRALTEAIEQ